MDYTDALDPHNVRTGSLRDYVTRVKEVTSTVESLEAKRRKGPLGVPETYALAQAYCAVGRTMEAAQLVRGFIDTASSPEELKLVSTIVMDAGLAADAEKALAKYLRLVPQSDARAWTLLARLQYRSGRKSEALRSMQMAFRIDRDGISAVVEKDQELYEISKPLFKNPRSN